MRLFLTFLLFFFAGSTRGQNTQSGRTDFTWKIGPDQKAGALHRLDAPPGTVRDNAGNFWLIYADQTAGLWHVLKGTKPDDLKEVYHSQLDDSFKQPNGDDRYWCNNLWIDRQSGIWYTTVHVEFHYEKFPLGGWPFRSIGYATSTDQGAHWHYQGEILTSDNPVTRAAFKGNYFDFGDGDQQLFVDAGTGYFYLWYMHGWEAKDKPLRYQAMRVARSPIKAKMAPGTWTKWYHGAWSRPGLGGHDSDIFVNSDSAMIFYSEYLKRYVAIGVKSGDLDEQLRSGFISSCTSLEEQNWTEPVKFAAPDRMLWYHLATDPQSGERLFMGQSFRLYSAANGKEKYMEVTFGPGVTQADTFKPYYPPESVVDHNSGWDRNYSNR